VKEEHTVTFYLMVVLIALLAILFMANQIPVSESRDIITVRVAVFSASIIVGLFVIFSYLGKWG
jgi:hypothetical protein